MKLSISKMNEIVMCKDNDIYVIDISINNIVMTRLGCDLEVEIGNDFKTILYDFFKRDLVFEFNGHIINPNEFLSKVKFVNECYSVRDCSECEEFDINLIDFDDIGVR